MSQRPANSSAVGRTLRTVGSAMFGVRGQKRHEEDATALSPVVLVVAAVVCMVLLVLVLVGLASLAAGG
ncbi:DUF2970 domain-containing protein [Rhodoferax sp. U2-2l]|uniref:DUF2970 domain-containing protein n=1 Tax=Rhodoferax sp. U2-2l TaxID=2884000 RepID=UPI001D0A9709|nr:DUF2970 domain-containing protein [Rhodoferax sp. U2-2l]MCB8745868.1 DUF2970 domain-containing protein [Rhodoferax sp. U2-2l]